MSNQYLRTVILEANHNNSIDSQNSNNNFTINTGKPVFLPKGTQISLDGCIINEQGASNTEVIELTNKNIDKNTKYTNNFMGIEMLYYMNHNGTNMVSMPMVSKNGLNVQNSTTGGSDYNLYIVSPRHIWWSDVLYLIYKFTNGPIEQGGDMHYEQVLEDRNYILYDERETVQIEGQQVNCKFRFMGANSQIVYPTYQQVLTPQGNTSRGIKYFNPSYFASSSPASMCSAIRKNRPNSEKWVYLSNQFENPVSDNDKCQIFTKTANIDLGTRTHETPDQLNFKINQQWTKSIINSESNIVGVDSLKYDLSIPKDEIDVRDNKGPVFNFSGQTLINIPANLQTSTDIGFESQYYSNMFVRDYNWWVGGVQFLNTTSSAHQGISPNDWTIEQSGINSINDEIFKDYTSFTTDNATFYPRIYGTCVEYEKEPIYDFGFNTDYSITGTQITWRWFSGSKPDGSQLPTGYTYAIERINGFNIIENYMLGKVVPNNFKYELCIYESWNTFENPQPLPSFKISLRKNVHNKVNVWVNGQDGNPSFNIFREDLVLIKLKQGSTFNGLPYYSFPNTNCGRQYGFTQPSAGQSTKKIVDDFTAIPRGFVIPSNIKYYEGETQDNILKKIQTFFRKNEIYIGNKNSYEEQQSDWKNWIIEVQLGFHNDNAIAVYNSKDGLVDDGSRGGGVMSFSFWEQWFSGLALAGNAFNSDPSLNRLGDRQSAIYPVASYTVNGVEHRTNKNCLRLMSRYDDSIFDMLRIDNSFVVGPEANYSPMGLSPNTRVNIDITELNEQAKLYNIAIVPIGYRNDINDEETNCIGFINALNTFGGNGGEANDLNYSHIYENSGISNLSTHDIEMQLNNVFDNDISTFNISNNVFDNNGFYTGTSTYNGIEIDMDLDTQSDIGGIEIFKDSSIFSSIQEFELYGKNTAIDNSNYYKLLECRNLDALHWGIVSAKKYFYVDPELKNNRSFNSVKIEKFDKIKIVIKAINGLNNNIQLNSIRLISEQINLLKGVDYSLSPPRNYRQTFRLLAGVCFGFDPSGTASPWGIPLNNAVSNNNNLGQVAKFRDSYNTNILYSSFIQNYISNIYLGCVSPTIDFNISRFELSEFHTPKKFNNQDGGGSGNNMGDIVALFNDDQLNYQTCQVSNSEGEPLQRFNDINYGINDSICGIGIHRLFVRDENSQGIKIGDSGVYECLLNDDLTTVNYENSLFNILGFDLIQLKPIYGKPYNRFSNTMYNVLGGFGLDNDIGNEIYNLQRYKSLSFFTTNSFLSQQSSQNMSLFPPNFPDTQTDNLKGLPDFSQSYLGFAKLSLAVSTDVLRAQEEPRRVKNPYYIITTNLPTSGYISNKNEMSSIGYAFKQYRTANYYFQYAQNFNITITNDTSISSIKTGICNPNGELANNIGLGSVFFYKFQFPSTLSELPQIDPELEELKDINENLQDLENEEDYSQKTSQPETQNIPITKALKLLQNDDIDNLNNPEYVQALETVKNFITNYLLTQIIGNDRQILTNYRALKNGDERKFARFRRDLLRNLRQKRKDFKTAYTSILNDITSGDQGKLNTVIESLRKATKNMNIDIAGIGIGSQIIGFPKRTQPRDVGRRQTDFNLLIQPNQMRIIREIFLDDLDRREFNQQMLEVINQQAFQINTRQLIPRQQQETKENVAEREEKTEEPESKE